jgi:hypothetical protein
MLHAHYLEYLLVTAASRVNLFQQEYLTQTILHSLIRCTCSASNTKHDLIHIFQKLLCNNLTFNGTVSNGIVGSDAICLIYVEGTDIE